MKNILKRCASLAMLILLVAALAIVAAAALAESETVAESIPPTAVLLSTSKTLKLAIGSELTLTPTLSPENATTTYTWKSSKKSIATVANGVVTAKKVGTATITVTTANSKKSTVKIKVYDPYKPTSVKLDQKGTVKLPLGDKLTLNATLSPETAQSGFSWKSSKKKIASVSRGVVTAKKVGTTTITVTTRNKKKAKVKIKVYDPYKPSSIRMDQSGTQTMMAMNVMQLSATMSPATARSTLKWKSSKKKVATVNSSGVVTGLSPGTTTITVTTRNKKKAKIKVRVVDDGNQPIVTASDYNLPYVIYACKNSHTIAIVARDENGAWTRVIRKFPTSMGRKNVTDVGIFFLTKKERWHKWGSGYSPYANKLSVGLYLHGPIYKSKNQNTIRPSYYNVIGKDGSSGCLRTTCGCAAWVYYNCPVGTQIIIGQNSKFSTPKPAKLSKSAKKDPTDPGSNPEILVTRFSVEPSSLTLNQGATQPLTALNIYPSSNSTGGKFTYYSSNKNVATISSSGVVTAVAPGSAIVLVTAADDFAYSVQVPVTVVGADAAAKVAAAETVDIPDSVLLESQDAIEEAVPVVDEIIPAEAEATDAEPAPAVVTEASAAEQVVSENGEAAVEADADSADAQSPIADEESHTEGEIITGTDEADDSASEILYEDDFWFTAEPVSEDQDVLTFE